MLFFYIQKNLYWLFQEQKFEIKEIKSQGFIVILNNDNLKVLNKITFSEARKAPLILFIYLCLTMQGNPITALFGKAYKTAAIKEKS